MTHSTSARPDSSVLTCRVCGGVMQKGRDSRPQGLAAHRACIIAEQIVPCLFCGTEFRSKHRSNGRGRTRCCSKSCARKLEIREGRHLLQDGKQVGRDPERRRASSGVATRKRRALRAGVASDPYTVDLVAERDEFVCHLCGHSVDMSLYWPDRYSPSVDHVVPLSQGGDDTLANVRLSHLTCNVRRNAKSLDEWEAWRKAQGGESDGREEAVATSASRSAR